MAMSAPTFEVLNVEMAYLLNSLWYSVLCLDRLIYSFSTGELGYAMYAAGCRGSERSRLLHPLSADCGSDVGVSSLRRCRRTEWCLGAVDDCV